ncbi:Diaminopimelate epimerase [Hydrogenobaculum sp. Y04AAS1]|uniref:Diaminopimelate epimerase n=1 Tax=Hydrogenobaculum sp. (strain Y04AAS1) TaxID=380749 RepID=DAPF_HYDS0|nr:RecName: Full=Diaminopimelate epimerase; Short=DAP epimerase; AltName: Full=PLP-independent amino acid racemase [Hydrogenobaculum sp. Y04AAS1]ACG57851.1 Diaminopimelate epimerase [Hydrogenobaculum sp. Y04AAS1]HCT66885.1 diaminopimelate epimerase [Hydrogenobaculum sp.]
MLITKYQGSGNDFIIIDNRDNFVYKEIEKLGLSINEFVRKLCEQHTSVGADGVILIEKARNTKNHFSWAFFNADGSAAEMCGNGSRCAARFAYEKDIAPKDIVFETIAGEIEAHIMDSKRVKVQLTPYHSHQKNIEIKTEYGTFKGHFVNTGVPHFVIFVDEDELDNLDVEKVGRAIRYHEYFAPKGTNVNFVAKTKNGSFRIRTYERGVEGETLACGTGSAACGINAYLLGLSASNIVDIITKSGELLKITIENDKVFLEGPTTKVFEGMLSYEIF